ncbi:hypothetical protein N0V93_004737 [Gnomoniopsis smithogilvyi]|uniref:Apple domain-containing protein n=1 Tax=Gnomoniopsis smithogilvyi TaxID=1191159 RepID=A0A9W8YV90_9PEZI|nr:hypothetical protein N0V93_004737 [Gnomoniopsis smithogilvyi]
MAYQQQEKSPGGGGSSIQQSPVGTYEEGIEPVVYQHGQYPEHYYPGPEPPQVHTPSPYTSGTKSDLPPAPAASSGPTTLGINRKLFWILVGLLVLLLILVIGLAAGLGAKVAQEDSRATSSNATDQSTATSSASSTSTTLPTATYTSATSTATPTIPCPKQNLTLYTATTSVEAQFRLYCGFDFSGSEADDITSLDTVSMEACMDVCASTDTCQGAGWGTTGELSSTAYTCYLKTNLTTAHSATDGWCFAVNLNTTTSFTI